MKTKLLDIATWIFGLMWDIGVRGVAWCNSQRDEDEIVTEFGMFMRDTQDMADECRRDIYSNHVHIPRRSNDH